LRSIAIAVTALEARYLPALDPEWLQLTHGDREQWERFRAGFDPAAMTDRLGYPAGQAGKDVEFLVRRARSLDPLPDSWMRLICRAPRRTRDDALLAMDYREAAEILLLFGEDLADHGQSAPLPAMDGQVERARLSCRERSLDEDLVKLGLSPHPRVCSRWRVTPSTRTCRWCGRSWTTPTTRTGAAAEPARRRPRPGEARGPVSDPARW
jgi:hypothetical protein